MGELVAAARELRNRMADTGWTVARESHEKVRADVSYLGDSLVELGMTSAAQSNTLEYRLARAAAERLHGVCFFFEKASAKFRFKGNDGALEPEDEEAVEREGKLLFVGLGEFIALAAGL
jgi:hypothetical protein